MWSLTLLSQWQTSSWGHITAYLNTQNTEALLWEVDASPSFGCVMLLTIPLGLSFSHWKMRELGYMPYKTPFISMVFSKSP